MPIRSLRDGALVIKSVDSTPKTKTVDFVEGGLTWAERRFPSVIHRDRGVLNHARKGPDELLGGSFSYRYQTDDIRDTLKNLDFAGVAGANTYAQTVYAGWVNPETDAVVKAGATLFGRTIKCGEIVGGSRASDTAVKSVNLLFTISDPAGGSSENVLFMAAHMTEDSLTEGEEADVMNISFESAVKQAHTY